MINRRKLLATTLAAAAIVPRTSLGQTMRKVKMGSAFTTTTNAAFLMPKYLMPEGIDAEIITFPSLVQRMQAVASGDVDVGNGGLSATMQVATKGFPMSVQNGSIGLVSLNWKLKQEKLLGDVELVFMDNQDQPIPLMRGDVAAICVFEPYATLAELSGWGKKLWVPYDTPMGKTNLGFVASLKFIKADPDLTRKIVRAHVLATKELADNPQIAVDTTIKQFKMSKEVAEASTRNLFFSTDTGAKFQDGLKSLAKMMIEDKMLEREPDWAEFINTSFLPA
jgi:NitT/TauT family transport system substrate-binding protein